jgi:hypothetical protein
MVAAIQPATAAILTLKISSNIFFAHHAETPQSDITINEKIT